MIDQIDIALKVVTILYIIFVVSVAAIDFLVCDLED